jgi:hypothetical protein
MERTDERIINCVLISIYRKAGAKEKRVVPMGNTVVFTVRICTIPSRHAQLWTKAKIFGVKFVSSTTAVSVFVRTPTAISIIAASDAKVMTTSHGIARKTF